MKGNSKGLFSNRGLVHRANAFSVFLLPSLDVGVGTVCSCVNDHPLYSSVYNDP